MSSLYIQRPQRQLTWFKLGKLMKIWSVTRNWRSRKIFSPFANTVDGKGIQRLKKNQIILQKFYETFDKKKQKN